MIPKALRFRLTAVVCLIVVMAVGWSVACGNDQGAGVGTGNGNPPPTGGACDHPSPGCPCDAVGTTSQCGQVEQRVGTFVTCSMGTTTCNGSTWGACQGDIVTVKNVAGGGVAGGSGLKIAAVGGGSTACGASNPCDPYCQNFIDTPDSAISSTAPNLCYCNEPADPNKLVTTLGGDNGNPGACTLTGAGDVCNHDMYCTAPDGGSGTCTFYGVAGYNPACISTPDFTLQMGCDDGTNWNLEICNRGLVPAAGGTLNIAVQSGTPGGSPGSCAFPTGPALPPPTTGTVNQGTCSLDLATTPIGPGQCVSLPMNATNCTSSAGGAITISGKEWFLVNPPAAILPGNAPLAECDPCNNYTGKNPGNPGSEVCSSQICGTSCGAGEGGVPDAGDAGDAGPGCHTTVSGNIWDPGRNVTLPNIAVYEPADGGVIALPSGVTCSSCTSLLSPFISSTFTDLDGGFSLEVTGTTNVPIVIQTGKWRRQVVVPGPLTACVDNPLSLPDGGAAAGGLSFDETRLPKTAAEGDIPLTAIVTATHEPGECLIGKIMGATGEMAAAPTLPALPTTGKRIQIYNGTGNDTSPGAPGYGQLYGTQAEMDYYDQIFIPCMGGSLPSLSGAEQGRFSSWGNSGGRMFLNHKSGISTTSNNGGDNGFSPWTSAANYNLFAINANKQPNAPAQGKVMGVTGAHTAFKAWLAQNGAYGPGYVTTPDPDVDIGTVSAANGFEWVRGVQNNNWGSTPGGDYTLSYSFDLNASGLVPTLLGDGGAGPGCGRVIYNSMHVDTARGSTSGTFPGACNFGLGMTPNELMFEYLFFELSACSIAGAPIVPTTPAPPPSPPSLPPVSFTRDFHGICPNGTSVVWQLFNWNAIVPLGTNITFSAQTAADVSGAPGPYGASVPVGVATTSTLGSWDTGLYPGSCDGGTSCACTVDDHLRDLAAFGSPLRSECPGASPAQQSQDWLRVTMTLNPFGPISPVLTAWEQLFDCVPSQ